MNTVLDTHQQFSLSVASKVTTKTEHSDVELALTILLQKSGSQVSAEKVETLLADSSAKTVDTILHHLTKDATENVVILKQLLDTVSTLPLCTLTLAYQPTHNQRQQLIKILRQKVHPHLVLETRYDPEILVGFITEFEGSRVDASGQRLLTETIW